MSKVDAQRAMKAARHARTEAQATPAPTARPAAARATPAVSAGRPAATRGDAPATGTDRSATVTAEVAGLAPVGPAAGTVTVAPTGAATGAATLCGHRSMAGKDCRRPAGHPEKSHRYS